MTAEPLLPWLKVVEIGQYVAAPLTATLFADQGAEVVKIERPGGDPYRADPARYAAWNRGKRSVELDLRRADGQRAALELIADADVLVENLRPGSLDALGLSLADLRRRHPRLVTCSISGFGRHGSEVPGWEPLVHAVAGAQQGMFTADRPAWLPFPMASIAAGLFGVVGTGATLIKRESTGYGQHVETSLLEGLLFLNAGAVFHRAGRRPPIIRRLRTPVLQQYATADDRSIQINLSGTARWQELCRLVGLDGDGGLDFADPASLARLADDDWCDQMREDIAAHFAVRTADEWEEAMLTTPAAAAKCNTLDEWIGHPQAAANDLFEEVDHGDLGPARLVAPPLRISTSGDGSTRRRHHGSEGGALAGHRVLDISSFWAGPLAARILAELGADVVKIQPPGGEGGYHLMAGLPNIYVDGNRSKRGLTLDLGTPGDRARFLDLVAAADVVVENAVAGTWERMELGEPQLRERNPALVYARAKGFGLLGPLASRPAFDYVAQAATGMEMTNGGGRPRPVNFTANDYGTGVHLAAGIVLALLARARGAAVTTVEASLMVTATMFQAEHVAQIASRGSHEDGHREDLDGPTPGCHLYEGKDGWIVVCAVTPAHDAALRAVLGIADCSVAAIADAVHGLPVEDAVALLVAGGVPAAVSAHPRGVPDHPLAAAALVTGRHPMTGPVVQVGVPVHLSVDAPAVRGPAPTPARR